MVGQYRVQRMDWIRLKLKFQPIYIFNNLNIYLKFSEFKDYQRKENISINQNWLNSIKTCLDTNFFSHFQNFLNFSQILHCLFFPIRDNWYIANDTRRLNFHQFANSWRKKKAITRTAHDGPHPFLLNIYSRRPRSSPPRP